MNSRELIDFCLLYEADIRRAVAEKREDMCIPKGGGGGRISDPTAAKALRNISTVGTVIVEYGARVNGKGELYTLHNAEEWLSVVDSVWKHYGGKKQGRLLELRYKQGHYIIDEDFVKNMGYSRSYLFRMLKDVFRYAEELAKGLGILTEPLPRLEQIMNILKGE